MKKPKYIGVVKLPSGRFKSWIYLAGKQRHLGLFTDPAEAARAYDNAHFYTRAYSERSRALNFPEDYAGEASPPQLAGTERLLAALVAENVPVVTRRPAMLTLQSLLRRIEQLELFIGGTEDMRNLMRPPETLPAPANPEPKPCEVTCAS